MPQPLSAMRIILRPPASTSTRKESAPAASEFSRSSLTTDAGRSTTSPAAILFATWSGRTRMRPIDKEHYNVRRWLLVAQRHQWIDAGGPPCGNVTRRQCDCGQERRHRTEGEAIGSGHPKQQTSHHACERERSGQAGGDADGRYRNPLPQHHSQNAAAG